MSLSHVARMLAALLTIAVPGLVAGGIGVPRQAMAQAPARVAVFHAGLLPDAEVVTVTIDDGPDEQILGAVRYGEPLPYADAAPGSRLFRLYRGTLTAADLAGATPILTGPVALEARKDYALIVVGGANGYPLELLRVENSEPRPAVDARLRFIHAAPFDAVSAATAVDVVREVTGNQIGLNNIAFKGVSPYVTLRGGEVHDLKVVPSGWPNASDRFGLEPFTLATGEVRTLVAIGGAGGQPRTTRWLTFDERGPATLQLIHAAPYAGPQSPLQITLNGANPWPGQVVTFGTVMTGTLTLGEGRYTIAVQEPGDPPATLFELTTELARDSEYAAVIRPASDGRGVVLEIQKLKPPPAPPPPPNGVLRVVHLATYAAGVPGSLDVRDVRGQLLSPVLGAIPFGQTRLANLPTREYRLRLTTPGGDADVAYVGPFTLAAGDVVTIYVMGNVPAVPIKTLVFGDAGGRETRYYLPLMRK